jgi:hypothetical protein
MNFFSRCFRGFFRLKDLTEIAESQTLVKIQIKSTYSFKREEFLEQELTLDECREIVSDYEIKDEEVLKKVKHLYLRQDTIESERGRVWGGGQVAMSAHVG